MQALIKYFSLSFLFLAACLDQNPPSTSDICQTRHWAGWAYLESGTDFPFRVRQKENDSGGLDIAAANLFDIGLSEFTYANKSLRFTWVSNDETRRTFEGVEDDGVIEGTIDWGDVGGEFILNCAELPISPIGSRTAGLSEGFYRFRAKEADKAADIIWSVQKAEYGETYIRQLHNGEQRVAFPMGEGQFFFGKTLYDPSVATLTFETRLESNEIRLEEKKQAGSMIGEMFGLSKSEAMIDTPAGPIRVLISERDIAPLGIGIVIVPGSGWEIAEDEVFRTENLAALGFTIITYDKRGFGQSPGEIDRAFSDTAKDAGWVSHWAKENLKTVNQWGVLAISRGGWIAPQIPSLNETFDFAILSVAPATTPFEQELSARLTILEAGGATADTLEFAERYFIALKNFARSNMAADRDIYAELDAIAVERLSDDFLGPEVDKPNDWQWWRLNGDYDPESDLAAIKIPTLLILGEKDLRVPAKLTIEKIEQITSDQRSPFITIKTIPNVGHDLALPYDGNMLASDTLGSEGIEDIRQWAIAKTE